jgi:HEAT repeat protein
MSASLVASEPLLRAAWITAEVSLAGTALLLLCVFWMHWSRGATEARRRSFVATWRPRLAAIALEDGGRHLDDLPRLEHRDLAMFLREWIAIHEALDKDSCRGLQALSQRLGLGEAAVRLLRRRRLHDRLLGTVALGHVGDPRHWDVLLEEARSSNLPVSLAAARALVRLDPPRAIATLMPLLERRDDWPRTRIWPLLQEAGPDAVTAPLVDAVRRGGPREQARLARFLPLADEATATALVRELLREAASEPVIASCLAVVDSPEELPAIRALASHPRWHIRMLAAKALGRLGQREDEAMLTSLLGDAEWWVRYRAAQALVALPWMRRDGALAIRNGVADRYAADAMEQALAERAFR